MKKLSKIKNILNNFPSINRYINRLYWIILVSERFVYRIINRFIKGTKAPDSDTIYWIDPKLIEFHTNLKNSNSSNAEDRVFNIHKDKGKTLDGDWDISTYRFTDLDIYKAFDAVINHNSCWQDTAFYKNKLKSIENGREIWKCKSKSDFNRRCEFLDSLIESIRQNGYCLSSESYIPGERNGARGYFQEITVNIGRNGQYLFQDGRHRLSIALLLGIKLIPIKVLVRHAQYITPHFDSTE